MQMQKINKRKLVEFSQFDGTYKTLLKNEYSNPQSLDLYQQKHKKKREKE